MPDLIPMDDQTFGKMRDLVAHIRQIGEEQFSMGLLSALYTAYDDELERRYSGYESAQAAGLKPSIQDYGLEPQDTAYVRVVRSGNYYV